MSSEVLAEEFEVLESIYPTELSKISERELRIEVEPEEAVDGHDEVKLTLDVRYPDEYPDVLPELQLEPAEGDFEDEELDRLREELQTVGEENLGMAMTFTLVSHLREQLALLVKDREDRRRKEEAEKERLALEAEEAKTRGTPVTADSFKTWKAKYDKELAVIKAREDEEKMKGMTPKEREEYKKLGTRMTGRQLFERNKDLDVDDSLLEEGAVSVDFSQYEREAHSDEEDADRITFSDSD
ncbi:RWD-domain-containing protein [Cytidiella melzeri]|nr:RWD-domain-containing protein [Cytidiella melzeri]